MNDWIKEWSTFVMSLVAIIASITTLVKIFYPSKKEKAEAQKEQASAEKTDADAAAAWEGIAARSAEREKALFARMDVLQGEIDALKSQMRQKDELINKHQRKIEAQLAGIRILTEQLCELYQEPKWRPPDE
jgi:hypothetical protein